MKIIPLNLGGGTSLGRHPAAGSTRLLNCYLEKVGAEQKSSDQIWAADGLAIFGRLTGGERVRAFLEVDGTLYVVCGRRIFSVSPTGDETDLGGIATSGPVYMARNRRSPVQIAIVSDGVYMVIASGTLTTVAHPIAPPTSVCFMDGYFVFSHADGRISHTASDDAMTIDPLAWGAVETSPDSTTRVVTSERHVIAFGPASIEWFTDVGSAPFAFERQNALQVGCVAPGSVGILNNTFAFVAHDYTVRLFNGYTPTIISDAWVTRAIESEPDVANMVAVTWQSKGHIFYCLSGSTFTACYDLSTQRWHSRQSYGLPRWRVQCVTDFAGDLIAGDYDSNLLYRMSDAYGDEAGAPILMEVVAPPAHAWPARLKIASLHLDVIPGVGRNSYPSPIDNVLEWDYEPLEWDGVPLTWGHYATPADYTAYNPVVMMAMSLDGGINWQSEQTRELGKLGETQRRVVFRRLGATRQMGALFRFRIAASVVRCLMGAALEAEKLAA